MNKEPELVDLGLPSGNLWFKCNLGANSEEEFGNYYQFGSLESYQGEEVKSRSYWKTCPFNNKKDYYNRDYFIDGFYKWFYKNYFIKPKFDIVTQTYGKGFKIPTDKDFQELLDYTTKESIENYKMSGVNGYLFTSEINGKTLFIPYSGSAWVGRWYGVNLWGSLWSARLGKDMQFAWRFFLGSTVGLSTSPRLYNFNIRGVKEGY